MGRDYRQRDLIERLNAKAEARFCDLLTGWLSGRPAGWSGTAGELEDALAEWPLLGADQRVPGRNTLTRLLESLADRLAAAGWRVSFYRTAARRTIALERAAA